MHKFTRYEHLLIRQALLGIPETFPIESSPGESTSWIAVFFFCFVFFEKHFSEQILRRALNSFTDTFLFVLVYCVHVV